MAVSSAVRCAPLSLTLCVSTITVPTHLQAGGSVAALELGSASGHPGETVSVPVYATYDRPLAGLDVVFTFDEGRLEFLEYTTKGTAAEIMDPISVLYRSFPAGEDLFGINAQRQSTLSVRVPPGVRQTLGNLRFRILATAEAGLAAVTPVSQISAVPLMTGFTLESDSGEREIVAPAQKIAGKVQVLPPLGPEGVRNPREASLCPGATPARTTRSEWSGTAPSSPSCPGARRSSSTRTYPKASTSTRSLGCKVSGRAFPPVPS